MKNKSIDNMKNLNVVSLITNFLISNYDSLSDFNFTVHLSSIDGYADTLSKLPVNAQVAWLVDYWVDQLRGPSPHSIAKIRDIAKMVKTEDDIRHMLTIALGDVPNFYVVPNCNIPLPNLERYSG